MILEGAGASEMGRHTGCATEVGEGGLELDFVGTDGIDA